jgi:hypothetical protein
MWLSGALVRIKTTRFGLPVVTATLLAACDGSGSGLDKPMAHPLACGPSANVREMNASTRVMSASIHDDMDMDVYPCEVDTSTGETEPLYMFQWALNYKDSYFNDFPETFGGGMDLNVEPVHRQGFKGQGVNVLVVDTGLDVFNEDLLPNFASELSWSFSRRDNLPFPPDRSKSDASHGTAVAGIIAAAQNGKGVMGIAPRANLGAVDWLAESLVSLRNQHVYQVYGGAPWSSKAHIFNASYGRTMALASYEIDPVVVIITRGLKKLRDGMGAIFIKGAGNGFDKRNLELCEVGGYSCINPANDTYALEPNVVIVTGLNAKGSASSYAGAGSVVWVTGMAGEYGQRGQYGEGASWWWEPNDGPTIFSTDITACRYGYSHSGADTSFLRGQTQRDGKPDNPDCDYTYINGTSAAAPTISGVAALMLSANPDLTWRDVRDILRLSARKVDEGYERLVRRADSFPSATMMDLRTNQLLGDVMGGASAIFDGATSFPLELGWQKNAAGNDYSNWYGFGVPDAEKAVALALAYRENPALSRTEDVQIPDFRPVAYWGAFKRDGLNALDETQIRIGPFPYQQVTSAGKFKWDAAQMVDQLQVRLSGDNVCLGSLGIAVRSPSGTTSLLKLPNDHFRRYGIKSFMGYGLGSYAFYGEPAQGDWEILVVAANPDSIPFYFYPFLRGWPCSSNDNFRMEFEARIIAQ